MSSDFAIRVRGVSKRYRARSGARYETLRDRLASPFRRDEAAVVDALADVSFDVPRGRALGIVGGNGAGKSTLLKLLARITRPTSGTIVLDGRLGALLELGTGFHPELSGRENVYLNGAILGMRRREIDAKLDAIVAFAEAESFLDRPVKLYSTGMYLRLAFAVASHLDPDILVVDEVLAVGDARFQKKCLAAMDDALEVGCTVVLVSHATEAIRRICSDAVWLEGGRIAAIGAADEVVARYLDAAFEGGASVRFDPAMKFGDALVERVAMVDAGFEEQNRFDSAATIGVAIDWRDAGSTSRRARVGFVVRTLDGIDVLSSVAPDAPDAVGRTPRTVHAAIPEGTLPPGDYTLDLLAVPTEPAGPSVMHRHSVALRFRVGSGDESLGRLPGVVTPAIAWDSQPRDRRT